MANAPWGDLNYPWRLVVSYSGYTSWRWFKSRADAVLHIDTYHYNNKDYKLVDERLVIHSMEVPV